MINKIKAFATAISASTIINWGLFIITLTACYMRIMTQELWMTLCIIIWVEHMLVISNLLAFGQIKEFLTETAKNDNGDTIQHLELMKQELEIIKQEENKFVQRT